VCDHNGNANGDQRFRLQPDRTGCDDDQGKVRSGMPRDRSQHSQKRNECREDDALEPCCPAKKDGGKTPPSR
jgi:hypothetical protein